jgi:hypothetical protein
MPRFLALLLIASVWHPLAAQFRWSSHAPTSRPSARVDHRMTFDLARERVVLFGGVSERNGVPIVFDDTWEWDGSAWRQIFTSARPRAGFAPLMTYDPTSRRVLVGHPAVALWAFDGRDWQATGTVPPARTVALVADERRGMLVTLTDAGEVFELPASAFGAGWRLVPASGGPRWVAHATFDAGRGVTVVTDTVAREPGTFEWDGTAWRRAHTDPFPFRHVDGAAYDRTRQRVVLSTDFGWFERAGARWLPLPNASAPVGCSRLGSAYAHDATRGEMVLFGGMCGFANLYLDDTHTLAPTARPGTRAFGTQCASGGLAPTINALALPLLGNADFGLRCAGLAPGGPGAVLLGVPTNQPIAGCVLRVTPTVLAAIAGDGNGVASVPLPIPFDPRLRFVATSAQVFAWAPSLTALAASAGLTIAVGD